MSNRLGLMAAVALATVCMVGCRPDRKPLGPISLAQTAGIINSNLSRIHGTLQAVGSVKVSFPIRGGLRRSARLDGNMLCHQPRCFRFDLKRMGQRMLLLGANEQRFWWYDGEDNTYTCGHHGDQTEPLGPMPVRPDQVLDAFALRKIPVGVPLGDGTSATQRVIDAYQQVLLLSFDPRYGTVIETEYWVERYEPRLVRRVIIRDPSLGTVLMASTLDDYRHRDKEDPTSPVLPHDIHARWPELKTDMHFTVLKWIEHEHVGPSAPSYQTPSECLES